MNNKNILHSYKGIIDSTLREGQQYRYANFTLAQQKKIVKLLTAIGVERIEVGNPIAPEVHKIITSLTKIKHRSPILAHVRNRLADIKAAKASGVEGVNILCTISEPRLTKMNTTFPKYLEELQQAILFAQENHLEVRVSVEHFFHANKQQAIQVFQLAETLQVNRIGVADTLGAAMSWDVADAIGLLRQLFQTEIEVHFHNDLGQSMSNALTSLQSGANWIDTTLLGIGERNGIVPLSTFLASLYTFDTSLISRYHLELLTPAENTIARMIGHEVPFNLLTNQENGFSHKAGIHLHALINFGPAAYELFPPNIIGNTRELIHGTGVSGKTSADDVSNFYKKYGHA